MKRENPTHENKNNQTASQTGNQIAGEVGRQNIQSDAKASDKNTQLDLEERERRFLKSAYAYGMYAVVFVCSLLTIINIFFLDDGNTFDYAAILFSVVSVTILLKFKETKRKIYLLATLICVTAFISTLIAYVAS